jgi:hypothetical protein
MPLANSRAPTPVKLADQSKTQLPGRPVSFQGESGQFLWKSDNEVDHTLAGYEAHLKHVRSKPKTPLESACEKNGAVNSLITSILRTQSRHLIDSYGSYTDSKGCRAAGALENGGGLAAASTRERGRQDDGSQVRRLWVAWRQFVHRGGTPFFAGFRKK